jgi:hypothetical protein
MAINQGPGDLHGRWSQAHKRSRDSMARRYAWKSKVGMVSRYSMSGRFTQETEPDTIG